MLDINQPESQRIIEACLLIDELFRDYPNLIKINGAEFESFYGMNRIKLGRLGIIADQILPGNKLELANTNIRLLYKVLTGQLEVTEKDFSKIESLLKQLSNECFSCWCI